ncbi:MAG: restriction endonuclease subunit S [Selenomonadaceae bacterium]|nr:restriction endonuclease subunit S [Selenomonadaceae bacterium]
MTPQQLRNSILQMAIEGKLTEQRAEDGNASDLLKEIKAEKAKLITEKKIKKEKSLPEISENESPFEIPDNWIWAYVGDLFMHNTGKAMNSSVKKINKTGSIRKFITTSNVYWNKFELTNLKEMFFSDDELERCTITTGDILICEGGAYYGRTAIWNKDYDICFQNHVHRLRKYKNLINMFFYYIFYFYRNNGLMQSKGTAMPGLSSVVLHNTVIPLPPLAEQKRIVARLEEILPQVDEYEKAYNELQELNKKFPDNLKNSLLQMAIEGKLVEQRAEDGNARDLLKEIQAEKAKMIAEKKIKKEKPLPEINEDEIPFEIPDNWVWCRLDDIVSKEIRRGKSPKYDEAGSAFAFAQKCNSKYDGIRLDLARKISDESLKRYGDDELLQDKDIIINSTGNGTLGRIGMYKEIYNTNNDKYFADSHVTVVRIQKNILSEYIHIALLSYHKYLTSLGEGSTNQTELKPLIIKSLLIPIPPLAEQKRIVAKLEQILPLCDELSKEYK